MDDTTPKNNGIKWRALAEWMLAVLKLKYREVIYLLMLIMGIGCMFMSKIDQSGLATIPKSSDSEIEPYEYSSLKENCIIRPYYAVAPNDNITINLMNRIFNGTNCSVKNYLKNYIDLYDYIRQSNLDSLSGIYITKTENIWKGEIINNKKISNAFSDILSTIPTENISVNFNSYRGKMWNPYRISDINIFGVHAGIILPIFMVITYSHILISKWIETKALQLVCIAGIREIELWITIVLSDVPPIIFYTFISAINLCQDLGNVTYGFCLFFYILTFASVYISAILIIVIFRRKVPIITATVIWAIISIGIPYYVAIASTTTRKESLMNVYWIILTIFPSAPINQVVSNIVATKGYHPNETVSLWNWPKSYGYYSTGTLVIIIITQCLLYSLLFLVFMLMGSGKTGTAPIGWKNVFRASRWRRIFKRKRQKIETDKDLLAEDIVKIYKGRNGNVKALDGVSIGLHRGEVVMVIGANGSGKTTLLNIISGTVELNSGNLAFGGIEGIGGLTHIGESVGFCFQENIFFEKLTLREHLRLFGAIRRVSKEALEDEIERVSDAVGLKMLLDQYATKISGGQQRKLSAAMSLIGSPRFAILDEPTAGVDADSRQQIWRLISSFRDTTTLVSSHTIEEAEDFATKIVLLSAGKVLFEGSCQEMREKYNCGYRLSIIADEDKVDMDETIERILAFVREFSAEAVIDMERGNSIMLPINDSVPSILDALDKHLQEFKIDGYQVIVESLENVLLRIIFAEEATL